MAMFVVTCIHILIDLSTACPPVLVFMIYASLAWLLIITWKPYRSIMILLTIIRLGDGDSNLHRHGAGSSRRHYGRAVDRSINGQVTDLSIISSGYQKRTWYFLRPKMEPCINIYLLRISRWSMWAVYKQPSEVDRSWRPRENTAQTQSGWEPSLVSSWSAPIGTSLKQWWVITIH